MILCVIFLGLGIVSLRSVAALVVVRTSGAAHTEQKRQELFGKAKRTLKAIEQ